MSFLKPITHKAPLLPKARLTMQSIPQRSLYRYLLKSDYVRSFSQTSSNKSFKRRKFRLPRPGEIVPYSITGFVLGQMAYDLTH